MMESRGGDGARLCGWVRETLEKVQDDGDGEECGCGWGYGMC